MVQLKGIEPYQGCPILIGLTVKPFIYNWGNTVLNIYLLSMLIMDMSLNINVTTIPKGSRITIDT